MSADTEPSVADHESAASKPHEEGIPELDADILEILGNDPTHTNNFGNDIQKDLAVRLEHSTTDGLSKDTRKELMDLYVIPNNCELLCASILNPELKVTLTEQVIKGDRTFETKQKVTSAAMLSLGQTITDVLSSKEKDTNLLRLLMAKGRLVCDCQHNDTFTRHNNVIYSIK